MQAVDCSGKFGSHAGLLPSSWRSVGYVQYVPYLCFRGVDFLVRARKVDFYMYSTLPRVGCVVNWLM